jgi:hypothetical protein
MQTITGIIVMLFAFTLSIINSNVTIKNTTTAKIMVTQIDTVRKKISDQELLQYVGEYVLQTESKTLAVKIFVENGQLKAHPSGQSVGVLKFVGQHTFIHTRNPDIKIVFAIVGHKAQGMTLYQRGLQVPGKRKS